MCGLFGFVSRDGRGPSLDQLAEIAAATEVRGRDAFGFAWIDAAGRLRHYKQPGPITAAIELLDWLADARLLIGHTRYATQGTPAAAVNNHPHPCDGGWIVHNGMLRRYSHLVAEYDLTPVGQCDSEALALLIERLDGSLPRRCTAAVERVGDGPLAMAGLWRSPRQLIAIRRGNPLAIGEDRRGWYFASSEGPLPSGRQVADGTRLVWSANRERAKLTTVRLPRRRVTLRPTTA